MTKKKSTDPSVTLLLGSVVVIGGLLVSLFFASAYQQSQDVRSLAATAYPTSKPATSRPATSAPRPTRRPNR